MKKIRKAVRTFIIKNKKVLVINYIKPEINGYFDIPGGKIEDGETAEEASIREVKEETGINVLHQEKMGKLVVEYPDQIFDFDVFICSEYDGEIIENKENKSLWIDIEKVLKEDKIFASIKMLDEKHFNILCTKNFKVHFVVNSNHRLIEEVYYMYH